MKTIISGQWWRSHQSLACKSLRIFRFCVMSWKGESEPNIKFYLWRKVELVQKFTTIQTFGHNWWRADGVRVEYFPRIHHIAALQQSPRVHEPNVRTRTIPRTYYLHVDVQWNHTGNYRQWTGMYCWFLNLCPNRIKISSWTSVIPRTRVRNKMVFHLHWKTWRRMGQSRWIDDDQIWRKRTPNFPSHGSSVTRNAQKQRRWKIIDTLVCRRGYDWKCFSHNHFCQSPQ